MGGYGTKWQLKLPGNGGGAATLFTYISCTFRHFPCEIGRCFFGINKHDRHLARSRKDRSERGPHHVKGTRYVGELFGRPVGSISCHSVLCILEFMIMFQMSAVNCEAIAQSYSCIRSLHARPLLAVRAHGRSFIDTQCRPQLAGAATQEPASELYGCPRQPGPGCGSRSSGTSCARA